MDGGKLGGGYGCEFGFGKGIVDELFDEVIGGNDVVSVEGVKRGVVFFGKSEFLG